MKVNDAGIRLVMNGRRYRWRWYKCWPLWIALITAAVLATIINFAPKASL